MFLAILHPNQKKYILREIKWDEQTKKFIAGVIQYRLDTILVNSVLIHRSSLSTHLPIKS